MFHPEGPSLIELVRQGLSSTREGYERLAPRFDVTPFRTPAGLLEQVGRHIGPPGSVPRALDVCCGTGAGMIMLRPLCSERVVGIDFSPNMLAEATRSVEAAPGSAAHEEICGDVLAMDFDACFEVATCFGALGHFVGDDAGRLLARVHAALVPGGRFLFLTSRMPSRRSPAWWLARGFNAVMAVRNRLVRPPFVMVYLNLLVPDVLPLLDAAGFSWELRSERWQRRELVLVVATRRP